MKTATVWIEDGAFPLFFRPHHGASSPLSQRPGICHPRQKKKRKKCLCPGRREAEGSWIWLMHKASSWNYEVSYRPNEARRAEKIFETAPSLPPCLDDRPPPYLKVWITGALWAKRGEQGILREARDEERRKRKLIIFLLPSSRASSTFRFTLKSRFRLAWLIKRLLCRLPL